MPEKPRAETPSNGPPERTREELLDELVRMIQARDRLAELADRAIEQRDTLADAVRLIRDTTDGAGANIAKHALGEAEIPEPEDANGPLEALRIIADRENWTEHGLRAMAEAPLIFGHFDPIELAQLALDEVHDATR